MAGSEMTRYYQKRPSDRIEIWHGHCSWVYLWLVCPPSTCFTKRVDFAHMTISKNSKFCTFGNTLPRPLSVTHTMALWLWKPRVQRFMRFWPIVVKLSCRPYCTWSEIRFWENLKWNDEGVNHVSVVLFPEIHNSRLRSHRIGGFHRRRESICASEHNRRLLLFRCHSFTFTCLVSIIIIS